VPALADQLRGLIGALHDTLRDRCGLRRVTSKAQAGDAGGPLFRARLIGGPMPVRQSTDRGQHRVRLLRAPASPMRSPCCRNPACAPPCGA
jgi:hypothetical protein